MNKKSIVNQKNQKNNTNKKKILKASPKPVITSVTPIYGPVPDPIKKKYFTSVKIKGKNLDKSYKPYVRFGPVGAKIKTNSSTELVVTAPFSCGTVPVTVSNLGNQTSKNNAFTYLNPIINSISPERGPFYGGNTISISGSGFNNEYGSLIVKFGSVPGKVKTRNSTTITVEVPPAPAGKESSSVDVTVNMSGAISNTYTYNYQLAPFISSISPNNGTKLGGTTVTITGKNLSSVFDFGVIIGSYGVTVTSKTATQIIGTTSACTNGSDVGKTLDVTVNGPGTYGTYILPNAYTYNNT